MQIRRMARAGRMCASMRRLIYPLFAVCLVFGHACARAQNAPLFDAVAAGSLVDVERLIEVGANVDTRNEDGESLLYLAVEAGRTDVARFLLRKGADVKLPTANGEGPLHAA